MAAGRCPAVRGAAASARGGGGSYSLSRAHRQLLDAAAARRSAAPAGSGGSPESGGDAGPPGRARRAALPAPPGGSAGRPAAGCGSRAAEEAPRPQWPLPPRTARGSAHDSCACARTRTRTAEWLGPDALRCRAREPAALAARGAGGAAAGRGQAPGPATARAVRPGPGQLEDEADLGVPARGLAGGIQRTCPQALRATRRTGCSRRQCAPRKQPPPTNCWTSSAATGLPWRHGSWRQSTTRRPGGPAAENSAAGSTFAKSAWRMRQLNSRPSSPTACPALSAAATFTRPRQRRPRPPWPAGRGRRGSPRGIRSGRGRLSRWARVGNREAAGGRPGRPGRGHPPKTLPGTAADGARRAAERPPGGDELAGMRCAAHRNGDADRRSGDGQVGRRRELAQVESTLTEVLDQAAALDESLSGLRAGHRDLTHRLPALKECGRNAGKTDAGADPAGPGRARAADADSSWTWRCRSAASEPPKRPGPGCWACRGRRPAGHRPRRARRTGPDGGALRLRGAGPGAHELETDWPRRRGQLAALLCADAAAAERRPATPPGRRHGGKVAWDPGCHRRRSSQACRLRTAPRGNAHRC